MNKNSLYHLFFLAFLPLHSANAEQVRVACASNFIQPLKQIAAQFEQHSPDSVTLSFASSGKLTTQIINGAPFDLFLSADSAKPLKLEQLGKTIEHSRFTYASGRLVLWSREPNLSIDGVDSLQVATFTHFAIANAKLAPYGRAAIEALTHFPQQHTLLDKAVIGENIAQTYRFVSSGNAQWGLVALSQVYKNQQFTHGSGWVIPAQWHQPIHQQAVLIKHAPPNQAANAFYDYLKTDEAKAIIREYGYEVE